MLSINLNTPSDTLNILKDNFKHLRLHKNLTQEGLSKKCDVSLGSIKRFESTGQISLESLLKIANVLGCLQDFENIASIKINEPKNMNDLLDDSSLTRKRGRIK